MATMYEKVYLKDGIIPSNEGVLSIASSAVLYGLSVYTVFPVSVAEGKRLLAFRLEDHFSRLLDSAKIIGLDTFEKQWTYELFQKAVKDLVSANGVDRDVYIRTTVHATAQIAGTRSRGLETALSMFIYDAEPILKPAGSRVKISAWRRTSDMAIPSRAKVNGAYVNSVLAKQDAIDSGYDDCIFLDSLGHVCELSAANIFIVRNGIVYTPDTSSDILEGINRRSVIELLKKNLKMEVVERAIDFTELYLADEVFATGTSANIAPIVHIDGRDIGNGLMGGVTESLQQLHSAMRKGEVEGYESWVTEV